VDPGGQVYVADTWNRRVQVFAPQVTAAGLAFRFVRAWEVAGWYGQSLENKPYLAVDPRQGTVLLSDPEGPRLLAFDATGGFLQGWEQDLGRPGGLAVAGDGSVWVSDAARDVLLRFPPLALSGD
jgi:DNA-binding beta-propeller fold protein YncE